MLKKDIGGRATLPKSERYDQSSRKICTFPRKGLEADRGNDLKNAERKKDNKQIR